MLASLDIRELIAALPALPLEHELTFRSWLSDVRSALGVSNVAMYTPVPRETHWDVSLCEWAGVAWEERQDSYKQFIRRFTSSAAGFAAYDPFAIEQEQRNRALALTDLSALHPDHDRRVARVLAAVGASGEHQLRVLVCEGPRLLAWLGMVQAEPFNAAQQAALDALVEPLRQRLTSFRRLAPDGLGGALLEALFTQMSEAVFVLATDGRVELLNHAAEELLRSAEGRDELSRLREALRSRGTCAGYRLTPLTAPGLPRYQLAIREREGAPSTLGVARAVKRWQLEPKLALVLERLCGGASNKEIASTLGCAEVTVERHVTRLFRISETRSRTELVALVHRL